MARNDKEELYRRLAQARRMIKEPLDAKTKNAIAELIEEIEKHLAAIEAKDSDTPSSSG